MLVFASISPHPPILIPNIGKGNLNQVKKTKKALESLERSCFKAKPETLIVISPHGQILEDAFTINTSPSFKGGFSQFGDLLTKLEFKGNIALSHQIKESLETKLPVVLTTDEELDHGSLVPLYYLVQNIKDVSVLPVGFSFLDLKTHFKFGKFLKEIILKTNKRIGIIASGDLSHRLTLKAPAGYSPYGSKFDQKLIELLKNKDIDGILSLDKTLIEEAGECGLRSIVILLGILSEINYKPEILSYEGPFGVGYLVVDFIVS